MSPTTVLITGANSGVGFAATKAILTASSNYHVIMACRSLPRAEKAKAELEAIPTKGSLSIVHLEVTDDSSIRAAAAYVEKTFGSLDVLVNNAALGCRVADARTRFQTCMDVNVVGPAVVSDVFRPLLLKSKQPRSIYISSGAGSFARSTAPKTSQTSRLPYGEAYHVSKAAINMLALQEHIEYEEQGLKVFAASPGFIRSRLRGESEEEISGWGKADDASISGEMVLSIVRGDRDADAGKLIHRDTVVGW